MTDDVLTAFGIVTSIVGIVLFARTKAVGDNSMHVLGMQVKVSHPSLLIFFAGILLVLVPRLLPDGQQPPAAEQGDPADEGADSVTAEAAEPAAEPAADPSAEPEPTAPDEAAEDEPAPDEPAPDEPAPDEPAPEEEAAQ